MEEGNIESVRKMRFERVLFLIVTYYHDESEYRLESGKEKSSRWAHTATREIQREVGTEDDEKNVL